MKKEIPALDPILRQYLDNDAGFWSLRHPLVYSVPYTPELNAILNSCFAQKLLSLERCMSTKDWAQLIYLYEKPHRATAFNLIKHKLKNKQYWQLLANLYLESENINQNLRLWSRFLGSRKSDPEFFMEPKEREYLESLPDILTIYRGHFGQNKFGLSYTLKMEMAEWFANRFIRTGKGLYGGKGMVYQRQIKKSQVFAYLSGRNEEEIIIHPKFIGGGSASD